MKCDQKKQHKHLEDDQMKNMIDSAVKDHVKSIRTVQEILHKAEICETDFISILSNVVIYMASNSINHFVTSGFMSKGEAINMLYSGIADRLGIQIVNLDSEKMKAEMHKYEAKLH